SSWELPDLQEGKIEAISDSDGVNYPWYGNTTETCTIVGPTKRDSKFIISMNDNFYPSVTWAVPVSESNVAKLTNIYRDQSFTTWLVATNTSTNDMIILQTLHWRMQLSIEVNPNRPLGQRARLREPIAQDQPKILSKNEPIPPSALVKPNANDAQVLMWRPKYGQPLVVIPPKHRPRDGLPQPSWHLLPFGEGEARPGHLTPRAPSPRVSSLGSSFTCKPPRINCFFSFSSSSSSFFCFLFFCLFFKHLFTRFRGGRRRSRS
ncbi:Hypothetical predicted protein, partial [Lynx pardinus]